ncbi:MAG: glycosyltransferase family 4 protein [Candidatus Woesearchaeota archaeon]
MHFTPKHKKIIVMRTIESFFPYISGPANQAFKISQELEKRNIHSPIITTDYHAKDAPPHEFFNGVEVYRFPVRWRFMKYLYSPSIKNVLSDFDIIHAHNYRSYQTEVAYKIAKKYNKPLVINTHGSLLGYNQILDGYKKIPYRAYDLFGRKIIHEADAVIVSSKLEYKEAKIFGVEDKKLHIIPMGINVDEYKPAKKTWNETRLLFVGRISRDRNLEPVIKAMKRLAKENFTLTIVGDEAFRSDASKKGYLDELKALSYNLGVSDKVQFVGQKTGEELKWYYKHSDIFIYTSKWENFGQSILEAAAGGMPLILSRVGIAEELVDVGLVYLLDDCSVDEIALKAMQIVKKRPERKSLIKKIKKIFNWEDIIEKYLQVYMSLLKTETVSPSR